MNFRFVLLGIILALGIVTWGLILLYWKRTLDEAQLRLRQALVRKWSAVVVFVILGVAIVYWRILALGLVEPGPGSALFPLALIVGLIASVAVRGLWYFTYLSRKLSWLNTVAYRVTIQTGIITIVTLVTLYDFAGLPPAVAFSQQSNERAAQFLLVFTFLIFIVGMGEFFLQQILPNPEDMKGEANDGANQAGGSTAIEQPHSLVMLFDVPPPVRVIFGQYLLYFEQFLRDVGVEVHTAISDQAGKVLFSVTPDDKEQALHNIKAALEIYLRLPLNPIEDTAQQPIAAQRLEANILQLKSQVKLAEAESQAKDAQLQAKDAQIEAKSAESQAKDTTIEYQRRIINFQQLLLSGEVVMDSLREVKPKSADLKPKPTDPEDIIPGIVSLIPVSGKGVQLNLGQILRHIKSWFRKEEEPDSELDDDQPKLLKE